MDENEFELNGKHYVAYNDEFGDCMECDCFAGLFGCLAILNDWQSFFGAERKDGVDVIFLENK